MTDPLRTPLGTSEEKLRRAVVRAGAEAYRGGLMLSTDGNLSARLDEGRILITPSGRHKGRLSPEDLLVIDLAGEVVRPAADPSLTPSIETRMHLVCYRRRADVRAVIHAHPPFCIALTLAGIAFPGQMLAEVRRTLGDVPTTGQATREAWEDPRGLEELVARHDAVLLRHHGALAVGPNLGTALDALERVEHAAKVYVLARLLGQEDVALRGTAGGGR